MAMLKEGEASKGVSELPTERSELSVNDNNKSTKLPMENNELGENVDGKCVDDSIPPPATYASRSDSDDVAVIRQQFQENMMRKRKEVDVSEDCEKDSHEALREKFNVF